MPTSSLGPGTAPPVTSLLSWGSGLISPRQGWGDPEQGGSRLSPESVGGEVSCFTERNLLQIPSGIRPSGSSWSPPAVLTHSSSSQGNGRKPKGEGMQGDVVWVLGLTGCGSQQCQVSEGLPRTLTVCLLHSLPWIAGQYGSLFKLGCGDLALGTPWVGDLEGLGGHGARRNAEFA